MADGRLVIGNRRYSSWSLRGWLAVRLADLDVTEEVIPFSDGPTDAIRLATPAGLVPVLEHRGAVVWDSLAIGEYCAELAPGLLPDERVARARARSLVAEMHSGFRALRLAMPMNCGRDPHPLKDGIPADVAADIARIDRIWSEASGRFLIGEDFTLADVAFAPVVSRMIAYAAPLSVPAARYRDVVRCHALMDAWYQAAVAEPSEWQLDRYEDIA
ncbi:glutathione S-transferase [Lichenicoccus sp.]|uniref:glutathione S-transferase n=1 Tax=Lichenicoccus sp. TaxID=2781899 RepID=UPI003D0F6ABC